MNPGIYGKKLATWLTDELPKSGIQSNRMYPEDWGWEIDISTDKVKRYLGARNVDGKDNEWIVFIEIKNKMIKRLFGKSQDEEKEIELIVNGLETILNNEESIRDIDFNYNL